MIWSRTKVAPHSGQKEYEESIKASQPVKRIGYVSIDDFCSYQNYYLVPQISMDIHHQKIDSSPGFIQFF